MNEEQLQILIEAISSHAQPRPYDWYILILTFLSIIISGIAIFFAIQVPKKIAKEQNKIALFAKRHATISSVKRILSIRHPLNMALSIYEKHSNDNVGDGIAFYTYAFLKCFDEITIDGNFHMSDNADMEQNKDTIRASMFKMLIEKRSLSKDVELLFSKEISDKINNILDVGTSVYCFPNDVKIQVNKAEKYIKLCNEFEQSHLPIMENEVNI